MSSKKKPAEEHTLLKTKIPGFDELIIDGGIPAGISLLISGGPGSGKTIFCLQTLHNLAQQGKKCAYISFEESPERLKRHMNKFGWDAEKLEKQKKLVIIRTDPFRIARGVEALLAKATGSMTMRVKNVMPLFPKKFKPDVVVIDSISALASAFMGKTESYRIYIEQLFRFFENEGITSLMITETQDAPRKFSESGVEEFLADGVIVLYNMRVGNTRSRAIEILKLRGVHHEMKLAPFKVTKDGINVFPEENVYYDEEK